MNTNELNTIGYLVNIQELSISSITYRNYLEEYGSDKTTSPRGVEPRIHIEEEELSDGGIEYHIMSWGIGGNNNHHTGTSFFTKEEAELFCYEIYEEYLNNYRGDYPIFFSSKEEAVVDIAEVLNLSFNCANSLINHAELASKIRRDRDAKWRKEMTIKNEKEKALSKLDAEKIIPLLDEDFKKSIKEASSFSGNRKSELLKEAFYSFLFRVNYNLQSDFWQTFRLVKNSLLTK